jgi:hypothetical protein
MKKENRKFRIKTGERENYPDHYNMPLEIHYKGFKCMINAGYGDNIAVFRDGQNFVILATNTRLDYAGIDYIVFDCDGLTMHQDIFIQNTEEFSNDAGLKKDLLDYSENFIASFLLQYI